MADAVASGLAASLATAARYVTLPVAPAPVTPPGTPPAANPNAPAYISPSVTFDPVTDIVILTFRNSETGKIVEQIPPSEVLSRYREVDETGIADPILPRSTPDALAGTAMGMPGDSRPSAPAPTSTDSSGPSSSSTSSSTAGRFA
jgi:hypothetical protein